MDLKSLTQKKISGIPVIYIILGVVVIALVGAVKLKPVKEADATDTGDDEAAGDLPDTSQPVFSATPTITQPSGVVTSVTAVSGPDSDDLWKRRAIDWLRQNGYTLDVATSAITKYLAGQSLTATEAAARDKAVANFGLPPESIPDTTTDVPIPDPVVDLPTTPNYNGPSSKQGAPPTTHVVRGTSDNSFVELAQIYYGHSGSGEGHLIHSYNTGLTLPLAKGTRVHIPRLVTPKYYVATSATHTAVAIAAKNGTTPMRVKSLNESLNFPVKAGTRVRVR